MGNFRQHLTASTLTGVGVGLVGAYFGVPTSSCLLAGGGCAAAGLLPDIDSDTSRSFQECIYVAAGVSTMLLMNRLKTTPINPEIVTLAGALNFLFVRFGVGTLIKKTTVHRGLFHSIPAALLSAVLAFLVSSGSVDLRIYKALGIFLGFLSHLIVDEMFSIDLAGHRLKKSFGTALKMYSPKNIRGTVFLYGAVVALFGFASKEPEVAAALGEQGDRWVATAAEHAEEGRATAWWASLLDVDEVKNAMGAGLERLRERRQRRLAEATLTEAMSTGAATTTGATSGNLPSTTQNSVQKSVASEPFDFEMPGGFVFSQAPSPALPALREIVTSPPALPSPEDQARLQGERVVLAPETLPLVQAVGSPGIRSRAGSPQLLTTLTPYEPARPEPPPPEPPPLEPSQPEARAMVPIISSETVAIPNASPSANVPKSESAPASRRAPAVLRLPL